MTSAEQQPDDPHAIVACTISRDVQNFDLLIEDMEDVLGENWGDLGFAEALVFFNQPEAAALEFVAVAVDETDEQDLSKVEDVIAAAKGKGIKVILIADNVTPGALHHLLKGGADEFVPFPLPEHEIKQAIERIRTPAPKPVASAPQERPSLSRDSQRDGAILTVHGLAGGVGATTFAVNLAWELATAKKDFTPKVCVIDLDLQYGSVATYLDLPRREAVLEMLQDTGSMDEESFGQALIGFEDKLHVLTAPADMVPLDLIGQEDVERVISEAARHFDYVLIDMPQMLVQWSETVLSLSHVYFALLELDMRSAQNALRLKRALQAEDLPFEKLRFAMNRAPKFTDLSGKSRVKRMAESLDIPIELMLPDGGKQVTQACDHGLPLANAAGKNPLRKELTKLALSLLELGQSEAEAA